MNNEINEKSELEVKLEESLALVKDSEPKVEPIKPVIIRIRRILNSMVYLHCSTYRKDVNTLLSEVEGRMYNRASEENGIPMGSLDSFLRTVKEYPNVSVLINKDVEQQIHDFLYAAPFTISMDKEIKVKLGRNMSDSLFWEIPGYKTGNRFFTIPNGEGWRLHKILVESGHIDNAVFDDDVSEFIGNQIKGRLGLDNIAMATDIDDFPMVPGLKNVIPRAFQKVAVKFFMENGGSGLECDEMGLGKTLIMIMLALITNAKTLIICPASLKVNWVREIAKFTNETVYQLNGIMPDAWDISHIIANRPRFTIINYDIIGRSIELDKSYRDEQGFYHKDIQIRFPWIEVLSLCNFDRIVLDECHYIKNKDSQRSMGARQLTAKNIIGLSGTPILNRPGEYWPILYMVDKKTFGAPDVFLRQYTYDGKRAKNVSELRELLKPIMIRRLKKEVIKELPPINRINDYFELSPKGQKLYDKVLAGLYEQVAEWSPVGVGQSQEITNILTKIMRMKQVVAIDAIPSTADKATDIYDSSEKKVLIFSQFKPVCYGINTRLGNESLGFVDRSASGEFITVDDAERQRRIDQFQNDPSIHYLCVTEKTAKEGYNITAAEAVIFNDLFWTPAAHQQAEGRAYGRLSNLHPIDSYYRIGADTICEWQMELLANKLKIIEEIVEGVNASRIVGDESVFMELIKNIKEGMWTRKKR